MKDFIMGAGANAVATLLSSILFVFAIGLALLGRLEAVPSAYVAAAILVIIAIVLPRCLIIANQWERMIVLRLGKLQGIRGPGLFFIIPFADTMQRQSTNVFRPPPSMPSGH
jgi:hypothetical protein